MFNENVCKSLEQGGPEGLKWNEINNCKSVGRGDVYLYFYKETLKTLVKQTHVGKTFAYRTLFNFTTGVNKVDLN